MERVLIRSNILNPVNDTLAEYHGDVLLEIEAGRIQNIYKIGEYHKAEYEDWSDKILLPCFCDLHLHWVQDAVCLMPKEDLIHWLEHYTWPAEARFADEDYCRKQAGTFKKKLLRCGTSMGMIYSSVHAHSVDIFRTVDFTNDAEINDLLRHNFLCGAVMMDQNSPAALKESTESSLAKSRELAARYSNNYVISPRFIPSCSKTLLKGAAELAKESGAWLQTHLAETTDAQEANWQLLSDCGLLGPKTVLGHCIHLDNEAYTYIAKSGAKVAHCPSSNAAVSELGLGSGLFDYQRAESCGVDWALASDIGAGPYLSMLDVMRSFVAQNQGKASASQALYRATLRGAEILGLADQGSLEPGKLANFVILDKSAFERDLSTDFANCDTNDKTEEMLLRLLSNKRGDFDSLVEQVYIQGKAVQK